MEASSYPYFLFFPSHLNKIAIFKVLYFIVSIMTPSSSTNANTKLGKNEVSLVCMLKLCIYAAEFWLPYLSIRKNIQLLSIIWI